MVILTCGGLCALILGWIVMRRLRVKRDFEENNIEPEALHFLLNAKQVLLYDVRQPLDFLAFPQIIPGAMRIAGAVAKKRYMKCDDGVREQVDSG
ncbi:hypothetical protein [Tunturiibacter gelidiferens]|uniref:hypothetical protein n=1 Tax=Tunturiibacter gelidiferens TaxID=3069689 RepID=UPI003D9AC726